MRRFRFHVLNDVSFMMDEEGVGLADMAAVRQHALKVLGAIIADEITTAQSPIGLTLMVDDDEGVRVANFRAVTTVTATENPFVE